MFAIPTASEWTIILNSDLDFWGAYSYNPMNDVLRVNTPVKKSGTVIENFSVQLTKVNDKEAALRLAWDTTLIELPISF